jgi:hypothetical protein
LNEIISPRNLIPCSPANLPWEQREAVKLAAPPKTFRVGLHPTHVSAARAEVHNPHLRKSLMWWLALLDVTGVPLYAAWVIWRMPPVGSRVWLGLPIWVAISFLVHRDAPKTLGWRADSLASAMVRDSLVFGAMAAALFIVGLGFRMPLAAGTRGISPKHLWNYFAFCLLQQVALNSLIMNRLLFLTGRVWPSVLAAAAIFAALHWPNPVLVPATFVAGVAMTALFARDRNILPITFWQAILGSLLAWAFPLAWHHGLRVGPGYYTFH